MNLHQHLLCKVSHFDPTLLKFDFSIKQVPTFDKFKLNSKQFWLKSAFALKVNTFKKSKISFIFSKIRQWRTLKFFILNDMQNVFRYLAIVLNLFRVLWQKQNLETSQNPCLRMYEYITVKNVNNLASKTNLKNLSCVVQYMNYFT